MTQMRRREALLLAAAAMAAPGLARAAAEPALSTVWDLSDLYRSPEAWNADRALVQAALPGVRAFKGRLGEGAAVLKAALQAMSDVNRRLLRLFVYATLKGDEDLGSAVDQERRQVATSLMTQVGEATAWVNPEVLAVGAVKIKAALDADSGLGKFRFGLEDTLRLAPHVLDDAGEALLASAGDALSGPRTIRSQLVLSDIPWPQIEVAGKTVRLDGQGYSAARANPDRATRKKVFATYFGSFKTYESSLGAALAAKVQGDLFSARARKYSTALAGALNGPNIPEGVYRTLVAEANNGLPVLHRYFEVRRRLLGLPDMAYHDIYPPLTKLDAKFDLPTTRKTALEALKPLGPDYVDTLAKATLGKWAHVYPQKGKAAGAYMFGAAYDVHPYLLLNHTDDFEGLTTYCHEWGHAMHSLLAGKAQPFETSDYPTFTAEVASTLNEQLLVAHLLKRAKGRDERLFYLDRTCEAIRSTFFRQTMFAEFELAAHELAERGEPVSGQRLSATYLDLLKRYHGPKVVIDDAYALEWAAPQHFFNYTFYVYQYATSVTAASAFADLILRGGDKVLPAYLGVLKAGGSDYPVDVLKRAGVDMTSPAPYRALLAKFSRTLDEMESLIG